jgi:hypothetical protein
MNEEIKGNKKSEGLIYFLLFSRENCETLYGREMMKEKNGKFCRLVQLGSCSKLFQLYSHVSSVRLIFINRCYCFLVLFSER